MFEYHTPEGTLQHLDSGTALYKIIRFVADGAVLTYDKDMGTVRLSTGYTFKTLRRGARMTKMFAVLSALKLPYPQMVASVQDLMNTCYGFVDYTPTDEMLALLKYLHGSQFRDLNYRAALFSMIIGDTRTRNEVAAMTADACLRTCKAEINQALDY